MKKHTWWFNTHRILNGIAIAVSIIAFVIAVAITDDHFDVSHKIIGT